MKCPYCGQDDMVRPVVGLNGIEWICANCGRDIEVTVTVKQPDEQPKPPAKGKAK